MTRRKMAIDGSATARAIEWWHARAPRERRMLAAMFAGIAAFVAWYGVLSPLLSARDRAAARHASAIQAHAEIERSLAGVAAAAEGRPVPPAGDRFHALISDSAGAAGVGIDRREPSSGGDLEIGIDAASTAALLGWLDALRLEHGISPVAVDIERRDGRLRARLHFGPP